MNNKKKMGIVLSIIGMISIVLITVGVSVAFFNYAKEGTTENSITTDSITFLYTENSKGGKGIKLEDSFPMSDELGKKQQEEGSYFDFKITSKTAMNNAIPYEVTVRKSSESTLKDDSIVKIYLTDNTNGKEEEIFLKKFSELEQTKLSNGKDHTEKTIYTGKVPSNSSNYEKSFRLRMWIDENADFSEKEDGTSNSGKTFQITVNVYANGNVVTEDDRKLESNTEIVDLKVNDSSAIKVENKKWDYEIVFNKEISQAQIVIETESEDTKVKIEKIDNLEEMSSKEKDYQVVPLANSNSLELEEGNNYYQITTTALKGETKTSIINIIVGIYKESILNGTDPVIEEDLIPVIIDEETGKVKKADISSEWYNYAEKEWANAIILKGEDIYQVGDNIPEEAIESYFVWIPKYSYEIFNMGNYTSLQSSKNAEKIINIRFGTTNTTDDANKKECSTPKEAESNGSCKEGYYMTHPAFTSFGINGFWVGKFETGYDGAISTEEAQVDSSDISKIIIKPNVYSWRNITVGNAFKASYEYQSNLQSHMMKNTEWGAVAYLQHSIYGSEGSVRINNNSNYITGYAGKEEPTKGYVGADIDGNHIEGTKLGEDGKYTVGYFAKNQEINQLASTTGNKTGIYDMSGGAWEYVMGYTTAANTVGGSSGITSIYQDFFENANWKKYYDSYESTVNTQYNNRILGDATGEMGPFASNKDPDQTSRPRSSWYKDYAGFVNSTAPWIDRGGGWYNGTSAGIFTFGSSTGEVFNNISFRLVLAPSN